MHPQRTTPQATRKANTMAQFGNACQQCGYSRCRRALHFHHLDASEKADWSHGTGRAALAEVEAHPERFVLLCANCHIEEHDRLDTDRRHVTICAECGQSFPAPYGSERERASGRTRGRYCSRACAVADRSRVASVPDRIEQRFWAKVEKTPACWLWSGGRNGEYGAMMVTSGDGRHQPRLAHHLAVEIQAGAQPPHGKPHWACGRKHCVRYHPDHLSISPS